MDYSALAGGLVTFSLLLLSIESVLTSTKSPIPKAFLALYGLGVVVWLILGVAMNKSSLVLISALQLLFIFISYTATKCRS